MPAKRKSTSASDDQAPDRKATRPSYNDYSSSRPVPETIIPPQASRLQERTVKATVSVTDGAPERPLPSSVIADSGIVNVDVGTECKRYYWHQDLIKKESPFIAAEIDRWFQENPENENAPTILVPKGQAECFQIINKWLYNTSSIQVRLPKLDIRFHCRLYEAATDLELERLQNDVVDYLRTNGQLANLNTKTTVSLLLHFQENRPNSPICELLVAALATRVDHQPQSYTNFAKAHPEQIAKLFANPKLAEKLIWSICAREDPYDRTPFAHSMEVINCMFHKHDNSSECTAYKTFAD